MAKKKVDKTNMYLLAIVGIVAVVGIAVLILNSGGAISLTENLSGEAISINSAKKISEIRTMPSLTVADLKEGVYYTVEVILGDKRESLSVEEIKDADFNIKSIANKKITSITSKKIIPADLVEGQTYIAYVQEGILNMVVV